MEKFNNNTSNYQLIEQGNNYSWQKSWTCPFFPNFECQLKGRAFGEGCSVNVQKNQGKLSRESRGSSKKGQADAQAQRCQWRLAGGWPTSIACSCGASPLCRRLCASPKLSFGPIRPSASNYFPAALSLLFGSGGEKTKANIWLWVFFIGRNKSRDGT